MKKTLFTASAFALLSAGIMAQSSNRTKSVTKKTNLATTIKQADQRDYSKPSLKDGQLPNRGCGTKIPTKQWDEAFNQKVVEHTQDLATGRTTATTYTIPIIFHIIYSTGEAVGSGHNISQAQVNSQIPILNADYGGTGYNSSQYASMTLSGHPAFYDYAVSAGLPAPDNGGVVIANSGITFCLATKNPSGTTLTEPGIDRVAWESISGATDPASSNIQTLMDGTIKPATIWDPTKYFNVWTSDGGSSGLLGYSTFPPLNATSPIFSDENVSSVSTTDGVWVMYQSIGNTGNVAAPYNLGRTLTHESGHYFGLRHVWGDGNCVTDYCNDTPPASAANYVPWPTTYPYLANSCTGTPPAGNGPDGDMFMAFMDYSDDAAMWMFTTDQVTRFHTALANSPWRNALTTSAANLCTGLTVSTPTAAFTPPSSICSNVATGFTDASSGPPTSWNWSVSPSTGVTITTNTISNPSITFTAAGTYTVTDAVSNSSGSNSVSHTVSVTSCTVVSCDTMKNITSADLATPNIYYADNVAPHDSGYAFGTNAYLDKAKAEKYTITTSSYQLKAIKAYLYVKGTNAVTFNVWNDNAGAPGTVVASQTVALSSLTMGYNTITLSTPYTFTTTPPYSFYVGFNIPSGATGDTIAVGTNNGTNGVANAGFEQWSDNTWNPYTTVYVTNIDNFMFPIGCGPGLGAGINQLNPLAENIAFFPNPSNGQINFAVTLAAPTDLSISVVNMLGQLVYTKTESNISNAVLNYDLSSLSKGVYFINIMDSQSNKTVKKMIIE
ncbi:MAG: T9SS type A sorting domain-containing protein [Bacteroidia bacterium]